MRLTRANPTCITLIILSYIQNIPQISRLLVFQGSSPVLCGTSKSQSVPLLTGEKTPVRPACATSVGERQQTQSSAASTSLNVRERESERTAVIEKENVKPWLMCSSSRSSSTTGLSGGETCLEENKISHVHLKQQRQTVETCWRSVPSPMGANVWQQRASHSHTGRVIREKVGFFFFYLRVEIIYAAAAESESCDCFPSD